LLADHKAVEELIHPHLGGADVEAGVLHTAIDGIDFPADLDLAVLVEGVRTPPPAMIAAARITAK
jgi:hypothetical protein